MFALSAVFLGSAVVHPVAICSVLARVPCGDERVCRKIIEERRLLCDVDENALALFLPAAEVRLRSSFGVHFIFS